MSEERGGCPCAASGQPLLGVRRVNEVMHRRKIGDLGRRNLS